MVALQCSGIKKAFGSVQAISHAELTVKAGEIRAILGGNGSGKSTFAKILGGSVQLDEGEIKLFGKSTSIQSPREAKQQGIVITSQELSLFTNQTVETNLLICDFPKRWGLFTNQKQIEIHAKKIMDELNLTHLLGKKVSDLAPNEQYLVEFAKALIQEPKLLIVDEITSALYREEVELVKQTLFRLKEKGVAVLFISHRMAEIYAICDSVTIMRNGETIATVGIEEKNQSELLSMMSGQEVVELIHEPIEVVSHQDEHPLLEAKGISLKQFQTKLDLQVYAGEFVGIAGLQGHGQSELVRTLFGMKEAVPITLAQKKISLNHSRQAVMNGLAFISGDREKEGVFGIRSLTENLISVAELVKGQKNTQSEQVLRKHGVKFKQASQPIQTLSGGNQQKVVISRWMITNPKVLLADDPTKGIDVQARLDVHKTLCQLIEKGSGVVLVSSDDEELVQLAHMAPSARILIMYEGNIVRTLQGSEITTENIVSASIPRGAKL